MQVRHLEFQRFAPMQTSLLLDEGANIMGPISAAVPGQAKRVGLRAVGLLGVQSVAVELGEAAAGISQWDGQVDDVLLMEKSA
jgi:hypothetical protein